MIYTIRLDICRPFSIKNVKINNLIVAVGYLFFSEFLNSQQSFVKHLCLKQEGRKCPELWLGMWLGTFH